MLSNEKLFEFFSFWSPHKRISYAINGVFMGLGAPLGWLLVDIVFCLPPGESMMAFVVQEITRSTQQMLLFTYMTLATSLILSVTGFLVGQALDWNQEKVDQLGEVHETIKAQKREFEERFVRLHGDMTNLYRIGADIQRSMSPEQVLELIAEGAHGLLNFDRVNIFVLNEKKTQLECRESRGYERQIDDELKVPLRKSSGILARTIKENKVFAVENMANMPQTARLEPPLSQRPELRSSAFACIPLRERGEAVGLIAVDNKESKREIRDEQVATLQVLADQGSISITNISLFRGIHKLHRELERNFEELLGRKETFSELAGQLTVQSKMISETIEQVAANADALSRTVTETTVSSQEMSASLNETASAVKSLFGQARRTLDSAERMSASIQQVETNVAESNVLSQQVKAEAQGGVALVHDSLRGITEIQNIVAESVEAIGSLDRRTEAINEVLDVINGINEKTNVLALNASIISAQAGEQGKGFAVVSDEIRALSEQTVASAREIEGMIDSVQEQVQATVAMIGSIPASVDTVVQLFQSSDKALNKILRSALSSLEMTEAIEKATGMQVQNTEVVFQAFGQVKEMIQRINGSIEEQNQGGRTIDRASEFMRNLTQEVAAAASEQARGFQQVVLSVNQVTEMMYDLFREVEQRRQESQSIIEGIELLDTQSRSA